MKKRVLITGATSGIGYETAKYFLQNNFEVIIIGRNKNKLEKTVNSLNQFGKIYNYCYDLSSLKNIEFLFEDIKKDDLKIDSMVINAGVIDYLPFEEVTEENYDLTMNTNLKCSFFILQKGLPFFNKEGTVVFTTSICNQVVVPNASVYSASKAAIRSLVAGLSIELISKGIRVNAVSPGPIKTPMFDYVIPNKEALQGLENKSPIGRVGQPKEIAKVIHFLSTNNSSYIVGEEIVVDGGMKYKN